MPIAVTYNKSTCEKPCYVFCVILILELQPPHIRRSFGGVICFLTQLNLANGSTLEVGELCATKTGVLCVTTG